MLCCYTVKDLALYEVFISFTFLSNLCHVIASLFDLKVIKNKICNLIPTSHNFPFHDDIETWIPYNSLVLLNLFELMRKRDENTSMIASLNFLDLLWTELVLLKIAEEDYSAPCELQVMYFQQMYYRPQINSNLHIYSCVVESTGTNPNLSALLTLVG